MSGNCGDKFHTEPYVHSIAGHVARHDYTFGTTDIRHPGVEIFEKVWLGTACMCAS